MADLFRFPSLERPPHQQTTEQVARKAYDRGVADGIAQGKEQGIAQGRAEAQAQAETRLEQRLEQERQQLNAEYQQRFDTLTSQLQQHGLRQEKELELAVYELISKLAETVLETELSINPHQLQLAISRTLQSLKSAENIQSVRLSPADAERLHALGISRIDQIPLLADDSLPEGSAQFNGSAQLHLLDFRQRLSEALIVVRQQLLDQQG